MKKTSALLVALLALPAALYAHAVVFPRTAAPGAYEKYVLRVPNERDVPTTRVTLRFPAEVTVVSFADVDGWSLEVETDSAGRTVAATWTGTLPAGRFVEFPFIAVNPRSPTTLVWPAEQAYASGEVVAWAGPPDSDTPASVTEVGETTAAPAQVDATGAPRSGSAFWLAAVAAVLSLIALGLALRKPGAV